MERLPMYVVMVSSECAPVAKVGGLGDVVHGLSRALQSRNVDIEIVLPRYDCLRMEHVAGFEPAYHDLWVPWGGGSVRCTVWSGLVHGLRCFFVDPHSDENFFSRGTFYGCDDEHVRFAFFSKAALEFLLKSGKRPDVIHTHDWQSALVGPLLFEIYQLHGMADQRVCHTIHNFKHQGAAGAEILRASGLDRVEHLMSRERMGDEWNPGVVNYTKSAIVFANFVTTVSPHHAWEARHTDQGFGLGGVLDRFQDKFGGILNGIDYDAWNPATDPHVAMPFTADSFERKALDTEALRERLWLRGSNGPLVAYVGRLDSQKGIHLIKHALDHSLRNGAQYVLLGAASNAEIDAEFRFVRHVLNDNPDCHLELGFDEGLAHQIYAGADLIVVPSLFEPCGLPQMIALRYGTVPIVRGVGGLRDSVFDRDWSERPESDRNGYVFEHPDFGGLESAMDRAFGLWREDREAFRRLAITGMRQDWSWNLPAEHYRAVYDYIRHR